MVNSKYGLVVGAGLAAATNLNVLAPMNQDMDDCKREAPGTPVPDEDTFQLPLEAYRATRSYPLCQSTSSDCSVSLPLEFDFLNSALVFTFGTYLDYIYSSVSLKVSIPVLNANLGKVYSIDSGCEQATDKATVVCSVPYKDLIGGLGDPAQKMCPNADGPGYGFQLQSSAVLKDSAGNSYNFKHKPSCTDYTACNNKVDYWELTYRCTKCPGTPPSSTKGCDASCKVTTTVSNGQTVVQSVPGKSYTITAPGNTQTVVSIPPAKSFTVTTAGNPQTVKEYVTRSYVSTVTTAIAGKDKTYYSTILEKTPITFDSYVTRTHATTVTKYEAGKTYTYRSTLVDRQPVTEKVLVTRTVCPAEKASCTRKHVEETGRTGHDKGRGDSDTWNDGKSGGRDDKSGGKERGKEGH
ncbi:hypothetical protein GQ53DRAFT_764263 [Thozetella sp. PMI_491]|nr:hypothetical protein GQ53DRAFT_764263 [Thozetella sp. PMI_491]